MSDPSSVHRSSGQGRLAGRVAIVTGAAYGPKAALGAVFAEALCAEGASVVVADIVDAEPVAAALRATGGRALAVSVDVTDERSVEAMAAAAVEAFGRLDILVNNAVVGSNVPPVPLAALDVDAWDRVMAVGLRGSFLCAKAAAPRMAANGWGKIVNIGSTTMQEGLPNRLHYVSMKGGILAMTRALARELGAQGIRVNTLATGLVANPAAGAAFTAKPELAAAIRTARAIKEDITSEDLKGPLVFLCSPESDAITGQFIVADKGAYFT
ncbi:MAG: SDR family oxidoreductase [Rhodoplanes sp.]|uniref:SDR family NAD(P)-dependent oxidoreductase n=1 Tax=Rhodoplanes sp. TaxID=1968906 RepID=UPI0018158CA8|nr:SDR family oxidoreductase [Rhodoplanes sp.]NVO17414.1 SDR family oxidoreductase [Rhodoplanes sp.]